MTNDMHVLEKEEVESDDFIQQPQAAETLFVNEFIDGILDPSQKMLGPPFTTVLG